MKSTLKTLGLLSIIPLLICLIFFSNIKGYFRFQHYCEAEGGLRVYEKLERNVGLFAKDKYDARSAALIEHIDFVRFIDKKDGKTYDLNYLGGNPTEDSAYQIQQANTAKIVKHKWKAYSAHLDENNRLKKSAYEIVNLSDSQILTGYYTFYYSALGGALGGPDWQQCSNKSAAPNNWVEALSKAFKN